MKARARSAVAALLAAFALLTNVAMAQKSALPFPRDQIALQLGALQMGYVAAGTAFVPANFTAEQAAGALAQGRLALRTASGRPEVNVRDVVNLPPVGDVAAFRVQLNAAVQAVMSSPAQGRIKGKVSLSNGKSRGVTAKLSPPAPDWSVPLPYAINSSGGGVNPTINTAGNAYIGGGSDNTASGSFATVGGGDRNTASDQDATVSGGSLNTASGIAAVVSGGQENTASGDLATVGGGFGNTASGEFSFAAGYRAQATNTGAFVWADATEADFGSTTHNQFLIRAGGGVGINTNNPGTSALAVRGDTVVDGDLQVTGSIKGLTTTYTYGSHDFSSSALQTINIPGLGSQVDNLMFFVYLVKNPVYYPLPGPGVEAHSMYRVWWLQAGASASVRIQRYSGTGETYDGIRIVTVPITQIP